MNDLLKLINDNPLITGLVILSIGLIIKGGKWGVKRVMKMYHAKQIYNILKKGLEEKKKSYLPTSYLSSKSGYTESQVEVLCNCHNKIRRNEKKLESWRIIK